MIICSLTCHLIIPGCRSLKEKRSQIKPLLARVHREFNVSTAEIDKNDIWDEAIISCVLVSNERKFAEKSINKVLEFISNYWKNIDMINHWIEFR